MTRLFGVAAAIVSVSNAVSLQSLEHMGNIVAAQVSAGGFLSGLGDLTGAGMSMIPGVSEDLIETTT